MPYRYNFFLRGKPCRVFYAPYDVRLFYREDESDDTVVQPDIMVICDKTRIGDEGCRGAPDLVIEILSPSNTALEMERKRVLYQRAGVREYWVVDTRDNRITVYCFKEGAMLTNTMKQPIRFRLLFFLGSASRWKRYLPGKTRPHRWRPQRRCKVCQAKSLPDTFGFSSL